MKKNFNKTNNKGFTLVELIVVIAVLAVITVVAAPMYIEYVEKARQGTDRNAVKELVHAVEVAYAGLGEEDKEDYQVFRLSIDTEGVATYANPDNFLENVAGTNPLINAVKNIIAPASYVYKSKLYRDSDITYRVGNDGSVTMTTDDVINSEKAALETTQNTLNNALVAAREVYSRLDNAAKALGDTKEIYDNAVLAVSNAEKKVAEKQAAYDAASSWNKITAGANLAAAKAELEAAEAAVGLLENVSDEAVKAAQDAATAAAQEVTKLEGQLEDVNTQLTEVNNKLGAESAEAGELLNHINQMG